MGRIWGRRPVREEARMCQTHLKGGSRRAQQMEGAHLKIFGRF